MREVLALCLQLVTTIALSAWIVRRDIAHLEARELARAWPEASLWSAVVLFSPLCIPIHFLRTRRSLVGLSLGLLWLVVALVATTALTWLVDPT